MKKKELLEKARELVGKVFSDKVLRNYYCLECKLQKVNLTPSNNEVRFYCKKSESIKNLEKIIKICETVLNNK